MFTNGIITLTAAAAMVCGPLHLNAGDAPISKPREAELESKVRDLERRIQQLEEVIQNGQGANDPNMGQLRRRLGQQNFEDLFEKLQREMERDLGPGFSLGGPRGMMPGSKPRLGVELAPLSDELRERFKNDVKEGAYVMSVVPGSPAEKAGLAVGDAVTAFNGKPVAAPKDIIDFVRNAPQGKNEVTVTRRGEALQLKVDLGEAAVEAEDAHFPGPGGWLRKGDNDANAKRGAAGNTRSRTEVKASALELNDELAKTLKLSDEQKKKMREVLDTHAAALNADIARQPVQQRSRRGNTFAFGGTADVSRQVEKHASEAEQELTGTLSAEQIKQWADYRKTHNSVSVQQSTVIENGGAAGPAVEDGGFGF